MIPTSKLEAALYYATEYGFKIFPLHTVLADRRCSCGRPECENQGKHPRIKRRDAGRGLNDATADYERITEWWTRWPDANIGIACGKSGLVVIDVDPRNSGDETLARIESEHGSLAGTPRVLTGGGGLHYYFRKSVDRYPSFVIRDGIDVKSDGGYVILPPSNHLSGRDYAWDPEYRLESTPIQKIPEFIETFHEKKDSQFEQPSSDPSAGYLGVAFRAAGWAGRRIDSNRMAVQCPWEAEHTGGSRFDGSTVVFGPNGGCNTGHFWCSHAHCQRARTLAEVLRMLPGHAHSAARKELGLSDKQSPSAKPKPPSDPNEQAPWEHSVRSRNNQITKDPGNAALILANADEWRGCLQFDEFSGRTSWVRPVPAIEGLLGPMPGDELRDVHVVYIQQWFARYRGVTFARESIEQAIAAAAYHNRVNPLTQWLSSLKHDGTKRIQHWLATATGNAPTPYISLVGRLWIVSAVARAYSPGCKADHMLILQGNEGLGKTLLFSLLAGDDWCLESLPTQLDKDSMVVIRGKWICVMSELKQFQSSRSDQIYDFLTRRIDSYRPPYGRHPVDVPRQCVFAGTTNNRYCLPETDGGNRRFWPVWCDSVNTQWIEANREQLFAEAVAAYRAGELWYPSTQREKDLCLEAQLGAELQDVWYERIAEWLENNAAGGPVTIGKILFLALNMDRKDMNRGAECRVGIILKKLGYLPRQVRSKDGTRLREYERSLTMKSSENGTGPLLNVRIHSEQN